MTDNRPAYENAHLQRTLAENDGVAELGIEIVTEGDTTVLRGHVESPQRRDAIEQLVQASDSERTVVNEIEVVPTNPPTRIEEVRIEGVT